MHIKNPCKMHYQIQNFVLDKTIKSTTSVTTSKTHSKIIHRDTQLESTSMVDSKSDRSFNFFINPLHHHFAMAKQSSEITPAKLPPQLTAQNSQNSTFQLLPHDSSRQLLSQTKNSFLSDKSKIDENIDQALKALKSQKQLSTNTSTDIRKHASASKKDLLLRTLKNQQQQLFSPNLNESKLKTARDYYKLPEEQPNVVKQLFMSPKNANPIYIDDVNYAQFKQSSTPTYNKSPLQGINEELKEFLEIEKEVDTELSRTINSLERSSACAIVSPTTNLQKMLRNGNKINQETSRSKTKINDEGTNFTFVESNKRLSSARLVKYEDTLGISKKDDSKNMVSLDQIKESKSQISLDETTRKSPSQKNLHSYLDKNMVVANNKHVKASNMIANALGRNHKGLTKHHSEEKFKSVNSQVQKALNGGSKNKKFGVKVLDPLELALKREEERKLIKQQRMDKYLQNIDKIEKLISLVKNQQIRIAFKRIVKSNQQKSSLKQSLKQLFLVLQKRQLLNQAQGFHELKTASTIITIERVHNIKQALTTMCHAHKMCMRQNRQSAWNKWKLYTMTSKLVSIQKQMDQQQKLAKENVQLNDKMNKLHHLNQIFKQRINDL